MVHRSIPAPFLTKTYEMLDDHTSDDVVSWSSDGSAFVVWKTAEFAADLLPKYFKHNNFSSFVRQLNTYGFRKTVPNKWEFANENFRRGRQELLVEIRRRKPVPLPSTRFQAATKCGAAISPSNSNSDEDMGSTSTSSAGPILANTAQVAKLCDENERLRRDNEILSSELAQVKRKCEEMVAFLSDCVNVRSDQKNGIICRDIVPGGHEEGEYYEEDDDNENEEEESKGLHLKLFGVWLTGNGKKAKVDIGEERTCKKVGDICAPPLLAAEAGKVCH